MSYKTTDKMNTVITRDYTLLQVMSRFGLSLGFGDKTVSEVCEQSGVDAQTLPTIRRKLIESIDCSANNEIAFLILKFFDAYIEEVRNHMNYENEFVFPYVEALQDNRAHQNFSMQVFASHHENIDEKLKELKNIIIT